MTESLSNPLAIEVADLTVAYRDQPVLWDVDLNVPSGVLMAIVGPNGAGKTTLIKAILGLVAPAAGRSAIHRSAATRGICTATRDCRLGFSDKCVGRSYDGMLWNLGLGTASGATGTYAGHGGA